MKIKVKLAMSRFRFVPSTRIDERGSVGIEFAILLPVLVMILAISTDYALAVLAGIQVDAAARAGAQYLVANGPYNTQGITSAVTGAIPNPLATISLKTPNGIVLECATTGSNGSYTKTGNYSTINACSSVGGFPYGRISAVINYTPIFTNYWSGLTGGVKAMSSTAVTRFQ